MKHFVHKQEGLTFVELILYMGVSSTILLVIVALFAVMLQTQMKQQAIAAVEIEGSQAMQTMATAIRNATVINTPTTNTSGSTLSVGSYTAALDPTTFDVSQGTLRMREGTGSYVALTSAQTTVKSITFKNISPTGTPGTVQITLNLDHVNQGKNAAFSYPQTFYITASLRQP